MAAAAPDIVVTDYESFNARIVQVVGEGADLLMAGTMGRKLTLGGAIEEEEFGRSGLHVASEIGAVMARMVDLGDKIDWSTAVFDWAGRKDFTRFAMHNQPRLTLVLETVFTSTKPAGAGSNTAEVTARKKLAYPEVVHGYRFDEAVTCCLKNMSTIVESRKKPRAALSFLPALAQRGAPGPAGCRQLPPVRSSKPAASDRRVRHFGGRVTAIHKMK